MKNFSDYYNSELEAVNNRLKTLLERQEAPELITKAIRYSLINPGKRLRPIILTEVAKYYGGSGESAEALADAVELVHTYSLIHDDLPAMDDDTYRRGRLTNHKVFGEDIAILAGDGLLNLSFERALEGIPTEDPGAYLEALKEIFQDTGITGLIGGQVVDVKHEEEDLPELIDYIQSHKTGKLFEACFIAGALPVLGEEDPRLADIRAYAKLFGKAFQMKDDLDDLKKTTAESGKDRGSDYKNRKLTYPLCYSIEEAEEILEKTLADLEELREKLFGDSEFFRALNQFVFEK